MNFKDKLQVLKLMIASYDPPYPVERLPEHLLKCPVHMWRAENGIELVHQEPDVEEQERVWNNWNLMDDDMKKVSDEKSLELFGMTNEEHHNRIMEEVHD